MRDLKSCPFCGENRAAVEDIETLQGLKWYVFCFACGATGGYKITINEAIEAWNTRVERTCHITTLGLPLSDFPIGECSICGCGADISSKYCWQCGAKVERVTYEHVCKHTHAFASRRHRRGIRNVHDGYIV